MFYSNKDNVVTYLNVSTSAPVSLFRDSSKEIQSNRSCVSVN